LKTPSALNIALTACFAALYVVFSVWNLLPVIGVPGRFITAAVVMAPLIGIILGPFYGVLSITLGGMASAFLSFGLGVFGPASFMPHAAAAFASGLLVSRKQVISGISYLVLFAVFAFFPYCGPVRIFPLVLWLDLVGLIIIVSPLQTRAIRFLNKSSSPFYLGLSVLVTCFSAALFGHLAGSILFEFFFFSNSVEWWTVTWQTVTFTYPIERTMIIIIDTIVGTALIKATRFMGLKYQFWQKDENRP